MIVTIDGPAGSGKSTVARLLAKREGFVFLNTGAMYRAMTVAILQSSVDVNDPVAVAKKAASVHVDYLPDAAGCKVFLDGKDVSGELTSDEVDRAVSAVAAVPAVREAMVALQRQVAQGRDVVCEGRDMGTVVFPNAELKIYLTATRDVRARRRAIQKAGGDTGTGVLVPVDDAELQTTEQELVERDDKDSSRELSPLAQAKDAVLVDTSALTLDETVGILDVLVQSRRQGFAAMSDLAVPEDIPEPAQSSQASSQECASPSLVSQKSESMPKNKPTGLSSTVSCEDAQNSKPSQQSLNKKPRAAALPKAPAAPTGQAKSHSSAASQPSPILGVFKTPAFTRSTGSKDHGSNQASGKTPYDASLKPMRAFHNSFDDYFDHAIMDFPWPSRVLYDLIGTGVYCVTKLLWPWHFEGEDAFFAWLKTQERGTVMIMNHVSFIETALPSVIFWLHGMRIRPLYKDEINASAVLEWVLSRVGGIPVGRGTSDIKALRRAQHAIERGESVLVFPEGTRIKNDEQETVARGGFAVIARMGKTTVTPSAVIGARKFEKKGGPFHRRHVFLKIGAPIAFGVLGIKGRRAQLEAMEALAMERVYELRAQLRLEHPGSE